MSSSVVDVTKFIDDAIDLAASIEEDIRQGSKISSETVLALSRFVSTAEPVMQAMVANKTDLQ